jgi:hypothetical protein
VPEHLDAVDVVRDFLLATAANVQVARAFLLHHACLDGGEVRNASDGQVLDVLRRNDVRNTESVLLNERSLVLDDDLIELRTGRKLEVSSRV